MMRALLSSLRKLREPYRMVLIGLGTALTMLVSVVWPEFRYPVWVLFALALGALLYGDLDEPVNYESLEIVGEAIEYVAFGQKQVIPFTEIRKVEFVREEALFPDLDGPYIESKWMLHCGENLPVEVMDEWPHRKLLLQAFRQRLPGFDEGSAREGLRAKGEGRWLCYVRPQSLD